MFQLLLDVGPYCLCFCAVLGLGALVIFLVTQLWKVLQQLNLEFRSDIPPGSLGLPFIGETIQFMAAINSDKGFYDFVRVRSLRYGNCFKTNIFGETHVFVSSTESAKAILNNDMGRFTKRYIKSIAELVGNQSLLCAQPHHHKLLRGRLINLFSTNSISLLVKQFDELIVNALGTWEDGGTVIVLNEALKITFKAMCKMLLSLESGLELELLQEDVGQVCEAMLAFPLRFPWTGFYKGLQARKRIMSTLEKIISRRRRGIDASSEDFLQRLLTDDDSSDRMHRLTDAEIQDNILTMIIAGQDTTASAITWMVKYLGENEEVLEAIKAEQLHLAEKTSKKFFLTLDDLNEMPYASKVIKESLRMASVVPWFPRLVLQDCEIEGYKIKKGWNVNIDARSVHLDPIVYSEPNNFNPSRFDDESKPYSFLAFGMGARTCLGMNMAKAMMLVFIHRLLTTYRWTVIDSDSSIEKWALFSKPRSGCPVFRQELEAVISKIAMVLWCIWRHRNDKLWQQTSNPARNAVQSALEFLYNWLDARNQHQQPSPSAPTLTAICAWEKPAHLALKCNLDAALNQQDQTTGLGMILRDSSGKFVACRTSSSPGLYVPREAKVVCLYEAIDWISALGV